MLLAEDGRKMSKRLEELPRAYRNAQYSTEPMPLRLYLLNSAALKAEEMRMTEDGIKAESAFGVIIPLWNAYSFFVTYAAISTAGPRIEHRKKTATAHRPGPLDPLGTADLDPQYQH